MLSLHDLPEEVLLVIFENLYGEGRPSLDLKSLRLVCRRYCDITSVLLFKHVVLDFTGGRSRHHRVRTEDARSSDAQGFLDFFSENDRCRAQVQNISIQRSWKGLSDSAVLELCGPLADLLHLMPRLKHMNITFLGTCHPELKCTADHALLDAVEQLKRPITLASGGRRVGNAYMHTFNSQLLVDRVTSLVSLNVVLLNVPTSPSRPYGTRYATFDGIPSQDIAKLISQNPGFKDLQLGLGGGFPGRGRHRLKALEAEHALENIGVIARPLRSLTLHGNFEITPTALCVWEGHWLQLQRLSLYNEKLVRQAAEHFVGRFPALRSLRIEATNHRWKYDWSPPFLLDLTPFLSSLKLTELLVTGIQPRNMDALKECGSQLQHLSFHVDEGPGRWVPGREFQIRSPSPSRFTDMLLSPKELTEIRLACPSLDWLAFDVQPFHLGEDTSALGQLTPMSGYSESSLHVYEQAISSETQLLEQYAARNILERFVVQEKGPDPTFTELTRFRSLRHLRLFIHDVRLMPWHFSIGDAIRTFLWLQKHKEGVPMESLVICNPISQNRPRPGAQGSPWIVYEMGMGKVHTGSSTSSALYDVEKDGIAPALFEVASEAGDPVSLTPQYDEDEERMDWLERMDPKGFIVPLDWIYAPRF